MQPIRVRADFEDGLPVVTITLSARQRRQLIAYVEAQDTLNYPPRGLMDISGPERIRLALEYVLGTVPDGTRTSRDVAWTKCKLKTLGSPERASLRLNWSTGFELKLGPVRIGSRTHRTQHIFPSDGVRA